MAPPSFTSRRRISASHSGLNRISNPVDRGHIAFRTDDIEAFKAMLRAKNIQFADYGVWAMAGWYQIFLQDPDGTIVEVHQTDYKKPAG